MTRKKLNHVRLVVYITKTFASEIRAEAAARKMPMGLMIEEAFMCRARLIAK